MPRKSSTTWVWVLLLALIVPMFLCAGLCGGLALLRVKTVEVAEQRRQDAIRDTVQAATEAAARSPQTAPVFQMSLKRVQADLDVKERLGEPIRQTGSSSFRSRKSDESASSELHYELKGPRGKASVHAIAEEIDGRWWFEKLDVTLPNGETIDVADVDIPIKL
jgi:hypothetical protein